MHDICPLNHPLGAQQKPSAGSRQSTKVNWTFWALCALLDELEASAAAHGRPQVQDQRSSIMAASPSWRHGGLVPWFVFAPFWAPSASCSGLVELFASFLLPRPHVHEDVHEDASTCRRVSDVLL